MAERPLEIAGASRPHPVETVNGDAWTVQWHGTMCRVAVIDGLGHGPGAQAPARRATEVLQAQPALAPADALHACHRALYGTRGAVISIAGIDLDDGALTYVGVGNVEAQLRQQGKTARLMASRGIVGVTLPALRVLPVALAGEWLLLLHTDGVSARFAVETLPEVSSNDPGALAAAVLSGWGRASDDATVVVVRGRR